MDPSMSVNRQPADPMAGRIARFAETRERGIPLMFIDSILPGHQRLNYALIGDTAGENPEVEPIIAAPHAFQIGMVKARTGNGPAYHTHEYVESFLVLSGHWRFYWGRDSDPAASEGEATLDRWDYISLPAGLYRGFEVAPGQPDQPGQPSQPGETEEAWLFAVLDPHPAFAFRDPIWSPQVVARAAEHGFHVDDRGRMIRPAGYETLRAELLEKLG